MDWNQEETNQSLRPNVTAYDAAIKLLCRRDYSQYKLSQKLIEKGYSLSEVEEAVKEVVKKRYLREDYYIEARIKGFIRKNYSAKYIQQKLAQEFLDVPLQEITNIFEELGISETEQIKKLVGKKNRFLSDDPEDKYKNREKISRFLSTKGHFGPFEN